MVYQKPWYQGSKTLESERINFQIYSEFGRGEGDGGGMLIRWFSVKINHTYSSEFPLEASASRSEEH